jgi:predicted 2-oxoglutarate/Fe(II)-dependent dioxygenase YbiX
MQVLRGFLSPAEIAELRAIAASDGWLAGRQGTGYAKLPLRDALAAHPVVTRALGQIGTPFGDYWDVYLLRYVDGAHVPDHVDVAEHGRRHRRLNAIVEEPTTGGELYIGGDRVALAIGDAVVFEPDREIHRVTAVTGIRLVFSVGAWL